jgi:protein phosphatase
VHFTCAARTDIGIVRSGNEDNYLMLADRGIFIVADGMGGHAAGEVASEMAVRITSSKIGSVRGLNDEQVGERVSEAIRAANDAIFERTLAEHDKRGMGTTATVLVLMPRRYLIGQVGDSRAYLLRNGAFQQLTKDHSYVQEQVDAGLLTPAQPEMTMTGDENLDTTAGAGPERRVDRRGV